MAKAEKTRKTPREGRVGQVTVYMNGDTRLGNLKVRSGWLSSTSEL